MIELQPMSLEQWKVERQRYLDSRSTSQKIRDAQYQQYYRNVAYYNSLGDRIRTRQQAAIPTAGEGLVEFLEVSGKVFKGLGTVFPVARRIAAIIEGTEQIVEQQLT